VTVSLVLVALAAVASVLMTRTLIDEQNLNKRRREVSKAHYMAEAGASMVVHWANYPSSYTPNPTMFERDPDSGDFTLLEALLGITAEVLDALGNPLNLSSLLTPGSDPSAGVYVVPDNMMESFTSSENHNMGRVKRIELLGPDASDPIACLFKIRSTGESPEGIENTVLYYAQPNPIIKLPIPAPLISLGTAAAFGNARIHWGESWSRDNFSMLNNSQMDYLVSSNANYDPLARYRTEGQIDFPNNWQWGAGKDLFDPTRVNPGESPASGNYEDAFEQHLPPGTLEWPDLAGQYETYRDIARSHGRYYSTDASGNIYQDGIEDADHLVDFLTEFGASSIDTAAYDLVFIDTIDGNPPAADGSNLATVSVSGSSAGVRGVFYACANFDASGVGSPPALTVTNPNTSASQSLPQIFLDGVLYTAGTLSLSGNAGVFGSAIAEGGFVGGGTPDVYYNVQLASGIPFPVTSQIRLVMFDSGY
jgi:hypothetical protein